jgi:hypothetical protein
MPMATSAGTRIALFLAGLSAVTALPGRAAAESAPEEFVQRPPILHDGEARISFGAGSWARAGVGALTVGNVDLRVGLKDRVELRVVLPGLSFLLVPESGWIPGLLFFGGISELGLNASVGHVFAYQVGLGLVKLVHDRVRLRFFGELRHRILGGEDIELAVPGPLPSGRAWLSYGEANIQIVSALAATVGGGYSLALNEGQSFGYGYVGMIGTVRRRADLFLRVYLDGSRGDRPVDPAVFAGISLGF